MVKFFLKAIYKYGQQYCYLHSGITFIIFYYLVYTYFSISFWIPAVCMAYVSAIFSAEYSPIGELNCACTTFGTACLGGPACCPKGRAFLLYPLPMFNGSWNKMCHISHKQVLYLKHFKLFYLSVGINLKKNIHMYLQLSLERSKIATNLWKCLKNKHKYVSLSRTRLNSIWNMKP